MERRGNTSNSNNNSNNGLAIALAAGAVAVVAGVGVYLYMSDNERPSSTPAQPSNNERSGEAAASHCSVNCSDFNPPEEGNCDTPLNFQLKGYNADCPICGQTFACSSSKLLRCNHRYHDECIRFHMECTVVNRDLCPLCREPIEFVE